MNADQKTILVVEDDDDSRQALCTMLEAMGFAALSFSGGVEALAGIGETKVDLALLDIMMPGMNGYELLAELKKRESFTDVPIIMVTAKDKDSEVLQGYQQGADYYITKPFNRQQLEYGIKLFLES